METFEIGFTSKEPAGLTIFEAALALMSFVVGGGIVSIPYAVSTCGIPLALFLNVTTAVMGYWSGLLYVEAKLAAPVKVMTLYELGFLAMGKCSIFVVSFISVMANSGSAVLYFILYGDLAASLCRQVFSVGPDSFAAQRWFWIGILAVALLPVVLKKIISEFKGMAYFLFAALLIFVLFFLREIFTNGVYNGETEPQPFEFGRKQITAVSIFLFAYNFSTCEFPLYQALGPDRSPKKMLRSIAIALLMIFILYMGIGLMAIALFGPNLNSNVLLNLESFGALSLLMRAIFLVVIVCHIPFVFLCAKEGACVACDEIINGSMTKSLGSLSELSEEGRICEQETQIIQDMDPKIYYTVTLALYAVCISLAISVDNLLSLFDFLGAFCISGIQFLIPGIAYLALAKHQQNWELTQLARVYVALSFIVTFAILYTL